MNKEVVGVDIDEVFFPMIENFLIDYNANHGTNFKVEDFKSYHFEHTLGISQAETVEKVFTFVGSDHSHIEPIEGAQDAIERIVKRYDVEAITARDSMFREVTTDWLEAKVGKIFKGIHFVGYSPIMEAPVTKAEICQEIGASAMLDDSVNHLEECVEAGIEGMLFGDYPWNQLEVMPSGITRCVNWQAVAEHLNV